MSIVIMVRHIVPFLSDACAIHIFVMFRSSSAQSRLFMCRRVYGKKCLNTRASVQNMSSGGV